MNVRKSTTKSSQTDDEIRQVCKDMKEYAKTHNLIILRFMVESYTRELFGLAIETTIDIKGRAHYNFGRLYHIFGKQFSYCQQGMYSTLDEIEVRKRAYKFFGIE